MIRNPSPHEWLERKRDFVQKYRALAWSRPSAEDDIKAGIILGRMLLNPNFDWLLDAAWALGLEHVEDCWRALCRVDDPDVKKLVSRAHNATTEYLTNIRAGYDEASR